MARTIEELDPLSAWDWDEEPVAGMVEVGGLINETWGVMVGEEPVAVLQKLNTHIFDPEVHFDIDAITERLALRGRQTPRLLRTRDGGLWHTDVEGGVWRCLSWVGEYSLDQVTDPRQVESAGFLLGRFHAALFDLDHRFHFQRLGIHDTVRHMTGLQSVLVTHRNHRLRRKVGLIADQVWDQWQLWDGPTDLPQRIIHGDPKISNVRFTGDDAVALIDLDTLQYGTLDAELGDALRSWCNPTTEDDPTPRFDVDLFEASMRGYVRATRGLPLTRAEWRSVVPGIERISLELAARFLKDALEESYFGWDLSYGTAGDHNYARGAAMAELALAVHHGADEAEARLETLRSEDA